MTNEGTILVAGLPRKMADVKPEVDAGDAELLQQQFRDALLAKRAAKSGTKAVAIPAVKQTGLPTTGDTIHTLCTSNGSPYLNFQNRIMCALHLHCWNRLLGLNFTRAKSCQSLDPYSDERVSETPSMKIYSQSLGCEGQFQ